MLFFVCLPFGGPTNAEQTPEQTAEQSDIHITITTHLGDDQHFQSGDEISLLVDLDQDAYVLLIYQDAGGRLVKIFPTRNNDGWVTAGNFIPFPRRTDGLRLIVGPPFGKEYVWAFAAAEVFPGNLLQNISNIATLRKLLQDTGISFSVARVRLTTHGNQS